MNTARNANANEIRPDEEFSAPIVGPTFVKSLITHGAGSAPPFKIPARSVASSAEKLPEICVDQLVIALINIGAE